MACAAGLVHYGGIDPHRNSALTRAVIVLALLAALLAVTPAPVAAQTGPDEVPISADAPTPAHTLLTGQSPQNAGGVDGIGISQSGITERPDQPDIGRLTTTSSVRRVVANPHTGGFILRTNDAMMSIDADGRLLGSSPRPGTTATADVFFDNGLWEATDAGLSEVDQTTMTVRTLHPRPPNTGGVAVVGTNIWWHAGFDGLLVVPKAGGAATPVALPDPLQLENVHTVSHSPGFGEHLVLGGSDGITIVDVSNPASLQIVGNSMESIRGATSDGRIFTSRLGERTVNIRTFPELTLQGQITFATGGFGAVQYFPDLDAVAMGTVGEIRGMDGSLLRVPDAGRNPDAFNSRADRALFKAGNEISIRGLGPSLDNSGHAVFKPTWLDHLLLGGYNLARTTEVTINGRSVPFTVSPYGVRADISSLPRTTDTDAQVRITTPFGVASRTIPADVPRSLAIVTVTAFSTSERVEPSTYSLCNGQQAVIDHGDTFIFTVARGRTCRVSVNESSNERVRSAFVDIESPTEAGIDLAWDERSFRAGEPTHLAFIVEPQQSPIPLWVFTAGLGDAPPNVIYPVTVTCGTWSTALRIRANFGGRVDVPYSVARPPGKKATQCEAVINKRGADKVRSVDGSRDASPIGNRKLTFPLSHSGHELVFLMDYGGADKTIPHLVAAPGESLGKKSGAGVVHVLPVDAAGSPVTKGSFMLRQGKRAGGKAESGDNFGTATAVADFNGDGWYDIAVGAPGEDLGGTKDAGSVHVIYGHAKGYRSARTAVFHQDTAGVPGRSRQGDAYGETLTAVDFDADGYTDLAIGIPGKRVNGKKRAGAVHVIYGGPSGVTAGRAIEVISQATSYVGDEPEAGDRFGAAIAADWFRLLVGVPGEDLDGKKNAGAAHAIDGINYESVMITQQGRGKIQKGDRLGAAVAVQDDVLLVGAPGENLGAKRDVGVVLTGQFSTRPASGRSPKVRQVGVIKPKDYYPGLNEAGGKFGSSIVAWTFGQGGFAVGAPELPVDGKTEAGGWYYAEGRRKYGLLDQSIDDFPGAPQPGDRYSETFFVNARGGLSIGAPGEVVQNKANAGAVYTLDRNGHWLKIDQSSKGVATKPERGDGFGG